MRPSLPQDDADRDARAKRVIEARNYYKYDYMYYNLGFAQSSFATAIGQRDASKIETQASTRAHEESSSGFLGKLQALGTRIEGSIKAEVDKLVIEHITDGYPLHVFENFAKDALKVLVDRGLSVAEQAGEDLEGLAKKLKAEVKEYINSVFRFDSPEDLAHAPYTIYRHLLELGAEGTGAKPTLPDYDRMFQLFFTKSKWAENWDEDWCFAYQAVAGSIPNRIRCIEEIPSNFPVTESLYQQVLGENHDLREDLANHKVFLLDFGLFRNYSGGYDERFERQKHLYAPMALFTWQDEPEAPNRFGLTPVAIQCMQDPGPEAPIFTPADGWRWKMARYCVQVATGCLRGSYEHFGIHVLMERILLATVRTLAPEHPLHILLAINFQYTLAANVQAKNLTTKPGHLECSLIAPEIDATIQLILLYIEEFRFDHADPPAMFRLNNTDDASTLPLYPFRDDTMRLWEAILEFVTAYVGLYYETDQQVADDFEVQDWVQELQSPAGARLKGIGKEGRITTVEDLIMLVARVMYRASAYHAAVNYSGFELFSYAPAIAYAGFGPPPTMDTPNNIESFLAMLPPMDYAWCQFYINSQQVSCWQNQLGTFPPGYFEDPRVHPLQEAFSSRLTQIEDEIERDNESRPLPYTHQMPKNVTASLQC